MCRLAVHFGPSSSLQEGADLFFTIVGVNLLFLSRLVNFVRMALPFFLVSRTGSAVADGYSSDSLPQASVHGDT